jgi:ATP-binding protein involved in chromosome partitioning
MSEPILKERVLDALKHVKGPNLSDDIVSLGLVSEVVIRGGKVYFAISVDPVRASELEGLRRAAEQAVKELPGVEAVAVTLTADREAGSPPAGGNGARARAAPASPVARGAAQAARHRTGAIPGVPNIVAVASGTSASREGRSRSPATSSRLWRPMGSRSCPWGSSSMRRRR